MGKNVWAAELSDADSQPTKWTLRRFYTSYAKVNPAGTKMRTSKQPISMDGPSKIPPADRGRRGRGTQ